MAHAKYVGQLRDDLLYLSLTDFCAKYPHIKYNTAKGKRAYWRQKALNHIEAGKMASYEHLVPGGPEREPEEVNPNAELAMAYLHHANLPELDLLDYETLSDRVAEVQIETNKPSVKIMYLNELLLGHRDADYKFFTEVVDNIPEDLDAIVISGILQGDFKLLQKARRKSLRPGYDSMDTQFRVAKQVLDALVDTNVPVVYNLSNDDRRVAEEYTIEQFRVLLDLANAADKVNYYQIDKMKTHPKWQEHLAFQVAYAFPYCLRSGRRLQTAEEMELATEGVQKTSEYLMLFDAYKRMEKGEEPNPDYLPYIDVDALSDTTFKVVDDMNLRSKTTGAEHTDWVRHNMGFSNESMYQNHMSVPYDTIGHLAASGVETPSMLVLQHNLEEVGVMKDGTWIVSCGGFIDAARSMQAKGSLSDVVGDQSKRAIATRKRIPSPSASAHERFDDGRHVITLYNEKLLSKADSCERTALPLLTDWQIGSLTARPDLLVKYLDYVQSISEDKVLYFNGDFIQGRNYPNFPNENQNLGLISIESQTAFVADLLRKSLRENDSSIMKSFVTVGNHEFNSGTVKWHGDTFTRYLRDVLEEKSLNPQFHEGIATPRGEFFRAWAAIDYVGDYGVYVTHMPLMKGAKGNAGLPIYQASTHSKGLGEAKSSIDFEMYGHWHHPQYAMFGDKVAVISGSIAGLSGYEWERGYRPVINGVILHVGGGLPPQLEFLSEQFMHGHEVSEGPFSASALQAEGYTDDEDYNASEHGIYSPRKFPKSALQKKILDMMAQASEGEFGSLR
jgi:hypothetical protein